MTADGRLAALLFAVAVATVACSAPMFVAHFRHAVATAKLPVKVPPVPVLFVAETVKVASFSALAVWAGARSAVAGGVDAPVTRALLAGDAPGALRAIVAAFPIAVGAAVAMVALEWTIARSPLRLAGAGRAPMSVPVQLTGVFYSAIAVELWFRWGVLASVAAALRGAGAPGLVALVAAAFSSALAYGVFAIPSTLAANQGVPPRRVIVRALAGAGVPSLACASAVLLGGLEAGMLARALAFVVATVASVKGTRRNEPCESA